MESTLNPVKHTKPRLSRVSLDFRFKVLRSFESLAELGLKLSAYLAIALTVAIAYVLISESLSFFKEVSLTQFLTGTEWMPLFSNPKFGVLPLLAGTFLTTFIALTIAVPLGMALAIYLSEFVNSKTREVVKPILELLGAVPTVVYGYFALLVVTPLLSHLFEDLQGFNVLSAGLVMGLMILPFIASLCEDAFKAVPMSLREASYALGSTRFECAWKVVFPAARSGVIASVILAMSRAIGETMIVAIAAGMQPNMTLNPLEPSQTLTAYIVQVSLGDLPHGSLGYQTIFACGLTLFCTTLVFNVLGHMYRKKIMGSLSS